MFSYNQTFSLDDRISTRTIIDDLNLVQERFVNKLPLVITIIGLVGFIGNLFTFLQSKLRNNSFCIYTLLASFIDIINLFINLFPQYLNRNIGNVGSFADDSLICKLRLFALVFLPQLSMNLLMMSLIDRYVCTFGPTSRMSRLLQLKMVPLMIFITIIISCVMSLYSPLLNDVVSGFGCMSINPTLNSVIYILIHGIITPLIMFIFVFLTYQKFSRSRQRVGAVTVGNRNRFRNQFIAMAFTQVFVSNFFILQWIVMYWYFLITQNNNKSADESAIIYFMLGLTNNLYYIINIRSFYLSTLTSRLFRETMIVGLMKLLPGNLHRQWNLRNASVGNTITLRPIQ
ncbi:hypothetical protein I4U23_016399 [Adineta vaga]|nr:hypothetical protein I4U23_016399 [Adineta vaga]